MISTSKGKDKSKQEEGVTSPIKVWDFEVSLPPKHCGLPPFEIKRIGFKTDDNNVLYLLGVSEEQVQSWDVSDGKSQSCPMPENEESLELAIDFEKNGVTYKGTEYGVIEVKSNKGDSKFAALRGHLTKILSIAVSDDESHIAGLSEEGIVTVWKKDEKGFNYSLHRRMTPAPYLV